VFEYLELSAINRELAYEAAEVKGMNKTKTIVFGAFFIAVAVVSIALASSWLGFLSPEDARNLAIEKALRSHQELSNVQAATSWVIQDLTELLGASKLQYTGDEWTITVTYAVVLHPDYTVEIQYKGEPSFSWRGTVDKAGNVVELDYLMNP